MHLDVQTLSVVTVFITALLGALLVFAGLQNRSIRAPMCGVRPISSMPPGLDSAGTLSGAVGGDACNGCVACAICDVACAICGLRAESSVSERPDITNPAATIADASQKSLLAAFFLSFGYISITAKLFAGSTDTGAHGSPGT